MRNFRFFSPYFGFFPLLQSLNVTVYKQYGFFSVLAAIIRTNPDKRPWIENGEDFARPFTHQPDRVARKASDVSAANWRYRTQVKKYDIFSRVLLRLFSGLEILKWHRFLYDKQQ